MRLAHFTTLLYFVSILIRLFVALPVAVGQPRLYTDGTLSTPGYPWYFRYNCVMPRATGNIFISECVQMDSPATTRNVSILFYMQQVCRKMYNNVGGRNHTSW